MTKNKLSKEDFDRIMEEPDVEKRQEMLSNLDPKLAEIMKTKTRVRTTTITIREGEVDDKFIEVETSSHRAVAFIDMALALGHYIGNNAESFKELQLMIQTIREAVTTTSGKAYMTKAGPGKALLELLESEINSHVEKDPMAEIKENQTPREKAKCAECEKPCPLAGKRPENVPIDTDAKPETLCFHAKGPEGLQ
jgi:hypothetical protein